MPAFPCGPDRAIGRAVGVLVLVARTLPQVFGVITSVVALLISMYVLIDTRRRDRRDLFLRLHEQLIGEDPQRGRYLLFQLADRPIDALSEEEFRCIKPCAREIRHPGHVHAGRPRPAG